MWRVVQADIACVRCPTVISAGRFARFGDRDPRSVWCVPCAKRCLHEDPPEHQHQVAIVEPTPAPELVDPGPAQPALFETEPVGRPKLPSADAHRLLEEARKHVGGVRRDPQAKAGWTSAGDVARGIAAGGQR